MSEMRRPRPAPIVTDDAVYAPMLSEPYVRYKDNEAMVVLKAMTHNDTFERALDEAEHRGLPLVMSANQLFDNPEIVSFMKAEPETMRSMMACGRIRLMPLPNGRTYEDYVEGIFQPGFASSGMAAAQGAGWSAEAYEADAKGMLLGVARDFDADPGLSTADLSFKERGTLGYADALGRMQAMGCAAPLAGCKSRSEAYSRIAGLPANEQDALYDAADAVYDAVCMHNSGLAGFAFDAASVARTLGHDPRPDCSVATLRDVSPSQELGL